MLIFIIEQKPDSRHQYLKVWEKPIFTGLLVTVFLVGLIKFFQIAPLNLKQFLDIWIFGFWNMGHLIVWSSIFLLAYFRTQIFLPLHYKIHFGILMVLASNFLWELPFIFFWFINLNLINPFNLPLSIMTEIIFGIVPTVLLLFFMRKYKMKVRKLVVIPYLMFLALYFLNVRFTFLTHLMRLTVSLPFILGELKSD